jgi:hypothetical protein
MNRTLALGFAFLAGCGGSTSTHNGADPSSGNPTGNAVGFYTLICDGSTSVRLAAASGGGGQITGGARMLSENGWQFLIVDGTCHAWVLEREMDPVLELVLSHDQERALSQDLHLADWSNLTGDHNGTCADASGTTYRFDRIRMSGSACGLPGNDPFVAITVGFDAQIKSLSAAATPLSGDLRYLVVPGDNSLMFDNRSPVAWPLAVPLESVWLSSDDPRLASNGQSHRATGDDAALLRAIRTTQANGKRGDGTILESTPVVGANGVPAALYMRDATPFEAENGLITGDVF